MRLDRNNTVRAEPLPVRAELVEAGFMPRALRQAQGERGLPIRAELLPVRAEPVEALVALSRLPFDKLRANGVHPFGLSLSKPRRASPTALRQAQGERWLPLLIAGLMAATPLQAQDRVDIDRTQIIGNRELPKVLYIVPWKKPMPGDLSARPMGSVLDEALAPVDRDVFRRQVQYDAQTQTIQAKPAAASPAARP